MGSNAELKIDGSVISSVSLSTATIHTNPLGYGCPQVLQQSFTSMNYIRGAVNVISAPYQYYKDINPSTLTGAIDVIVIQRPTDSGDTELACSPFHVRFGKWQVLRPSEKKVNVFVNGNPIPFNMKIGEAGEAFFVFETDDDVPADLITSPIIQPTSDDAPDSLSDSSIPLLNPPTVPTQSASHSSLPDPPPEQTQSASHSSYSASPYLSPSHTPSSSPPSSSHLPFERATSEPPPDTNPVSDTNPLPSIPQRQEYSWEWGAFPQPSNTKPSSGKIPATTAKKFAKTLRLTSDQLVRVCFASFLFFPPRVLYVNFPLIRNHSTYILAQILSRFPSLRLVWLLRLREYSFGIQRIWWSFLILTAPSPSTFIPFWFLECYVLKSRPGPMVLVIYLP